MDTFETTNLSTSAPSKPASCQKCRMILTLKPAQYAVYHALHDLIDKGQPKVVLVDAPTRVGKTHILSTLAKTYRGRVQFAVSTRSLASECRAETHFSYLRNNFHKNFEEVPCMLDMDDLRNTEVLIKLITYAQDYACPSIKAIIMDDCSTLNPLMVVLLYIVALKNKIPLIFSGSRLHLGSTRETMLHSRSNFDLIELMSDLTVPKLTENLTSKDQVFLEKLGRFGKAIADHQTTEHVPFFFELRYFLYILFREKFDPRIPESFQNLFMSPYHYMITQRLYTWKDSMDPNTYHLEYFNKTKLDVDDTRAHKFFPGLILVPGFKYIYVTEIGANSVVTLKDMIFREQTDDLMELVVQFKDGRTERIRPCVLKKGQLLHAYRMWLTEEMGLPSEISNFPLQHYAMTYYAAVGRTIDDCVELGTNRKDSTIGYSDASAVYVGLHTLPSESNICKFHAELDLPSFVATDIMATVDNQEYYYRCPATEVFSIVLLEQFWKNFGKVNGVDHLGSWVTSVPWKTVDKIGDFEETESNSFLRIKRSVYENTKNVDTMEDTPLMKITKFVKDNTNIVMDVLEKRILREAETALEKTYERMFISGNQKFFRLLIAILWILASECRKSKFQCLESTGSKVMGVSSSVN